MPITDLSHHHHRHHFLSSHAECSRVVFLHMSRSSAFLFISSYRSTLIRCFMLFNHIPRLLHIYGRPPMGRPIYSAIVLSFFLFSSFFFLFPRIFSAVADWMSAILPHMMWPCANLECRSEMCCTLLAENTGCKYHAKIRHDTAGDHLR